MNLLLLDAAEVRPDGTAELSGRRLVHAREVLRASEGDVLRVGVLGGRIGRGEVLRLDEQALVLRVVLETDPPPRAGVDLILAVPRPKALRRLLPGLASLGVGRVVLVNAARVEKSFFQSGVLASEAAGLFRLGLEQGRDTLPPELLIRERFRPFVEDELDTLFPRGERLVAHPASPLPAASATSLSAASASLRSPASAASLTTAAELPARSGSGAAAAASTLARDSGEPHDSRRPRVEDGPRAPEAPRVLAIGPEGGWVPFELELLEAHGFTRFSLGERPLRVEVAVPYALGVLAAQR